MKKIVFLLFLLLIFAGCSNANEKNEENEFIKYGTIKYGQKSVEIIEKYQFGDLSYDEANEKLDTIRSSLDATESYDIDNYEEICKSENDTNLSTELRKSSVTTKNHSISINLLTIQRYLIKNDGVEIEKIKQEIIDDINEFKRDIKDCL